MFTGYFFDTYGYEFKCSKPLAVLKRINNLTFGSVSGSSIHAQADTIVGQNTIEKILNGCVVQENWTGSTGFKGKSFNTFNSNDATWNQVWVDVSGATYHFKGRLEDGAMVMKGNTLNNDRTILFEMSYTPDKKTGHVRQLWKQSSDKGETWNTIFDGIYKKQKD